MDIYINEHSFTGQARSYNLLDLMAAFAETVGALQQIAPDAGIVVHSSLMSKQLTDSLSLRDWLFSQKYRDDGDDDQSGASEEVVARAQPSLQALIGIVRTALISGPWIDAELDAKDYLCWCGEAAVEGSTIDGAAQRGGLLVSLGGCEAYPDGPLDVRYLRQSDAEAQQMLAHFVSAATVRRCRRRYVPNPKHHPNKARGDHTPMELDRAYDRFTPEREQELRDQALDPLDTRVQRLLDQAVPCGRQLYARVWNVADKQYLYYEFQPDSPNNEQCCFHGYPVRIQEVPAEAVRLIIERASRQNDG